MRATLYTKKRYFELGVTAKNVVLNCFKADDEGYDSIQTITQEIKDNFNKITDEDCLMGWNPQSLFAERLKEEINSLPLGYRIYMNDDFTGRREYFKFLDILNSDFSMPIEEAWEKFLGDMLLGMC